MVNPEIRYDERGLFSRHWEKLYGAPDGGVSFGPGFVISWQRGALDINGRNGAFLLDILAVCQTQLEYYEEGDFACTENKEALDHLNACIRTLESRHQNRL